MNEEQLAAILADQLDLLLEGKTSPEPPPDDVTELLQVAQNLVEAAPTPRPEFGPALKESLLGSTSGGGTTGSGGSTFGSYVLLVIVGSLILVAIVALLAGTVIFDASGSNNFEGPTSTSLPAQPQIVPAQPTRSPVPPVSTVESIPTATVETVATGKATDSLPLPTPTIVLDILSPITITIETVEEIPPSPPPDLMPAQTIPSDDDNDDGGGDSSSDNGGGGGDHHDHHDD